MISRKVDVAIIGAGTAGLTAYGAARRHTDSVLLIEDGPLGTTCARVGCMPSKLLIAAADAAHQLRQSEVFGIRPGQVTIDGPTVMTRVRRLRDDFVESVLTSWKKIPGEHKLRGRARFAEPGRLRVDEDVEVIAKGIVVATGSRPNVPDSLQRAGSRLLTNDTIFELDDLPTAVAVFGPGVLGLELGQALSRLGVDVRLFGVHGSLGSLQDTEIRDYAWRQFSGEFYLDPCAKVLAVAERDNTVAITYGHRQRGEITEHFDFVLAATGRRPNLDGLDWNNIGLELNEHGLPPVDPRTLQCGDSPVFMAGDANRIAPVLHEAAAEGKIAGTNAATYPDIRQSDRPVPFSVVFTDPQIARVGLHKPTIDEDCPAGYAEGRASFEDQGRSRVMARNRGLIKVYGERGSGRFLGAEMFGPSAEHLGHLLAWAAQTGMTVSQMLAMPFYHPVVEEGLRTALKDLNHHLKKRAPESDSCLDCGPGD